MATLLTTEQITTALRELPGWTHQGNAIVSDFALRDFSDALIFVNSVGATAEQENHHPDIDIRYSKVKMLLTSHDSGGITRRDVRMAKRISEIFAAIKRGDADV